LRDSDRAFPRVPWARPTRHPGLLPPPGTTPRLLAVFRSRSCASTSGISSPAWHGWRPGSS